MSSIDAAESQKASEAELLGGGAKYKRAEEGFYLDVTEQQMLKAKAEMALDQLEKKGIKLDEILPSEHLDQAIAGLISRASSIRSHDNSGGEALAYDPRLKAIGKSLAFFEAIKEASAPQPSAPKSPRPIK